MIARRLTRHWATRDAMMPDSLPQPPARPPSAAAAKNNDKACVVNRCSVVIQSLTSSSPWQHDSADGTIITVSGWGVIARCTYGAAVYFSTLSTVKPVIAMEIIVLLLFLLFLCCFFVVINGGGGWWWLGTVENHENTEAVFSVFFVNCRVFWQLPCFS